MFRWQKRLVTGLLFCAALSAEVRSLTILHTNDLHARLMPLGNKQGGFAYLATVLRRERANCKDCILLNAGDLVQGTPVSTLFKGMPVYQIANLLGFDAAVLGNHEFDYGWQQVQAFLAVAKFPIVTSNLVDAHGTRMTKEPYVILNVNGLRVAVIGALTETLPALTNPNAVGEWHTLPVVATVRKYVAEVRDRSDLILVLGHIDENEELALLRDVPEVPIVVSGHIHTGLTEPILKDGRMVVRVKCYGVEVGKLTLQVDTVKKAPLPGWTWTRIPIDSTSIVPAPDVAREVEHWEQQVSAKVDVPLAVARHAFDVPAVKALMEQAMRDVSGADFAFMNEGSVRDTLPEGQLRERHIWNVMPFDNLLVVGKFKGSDLPAVVTAGHKIDPDREYTLAVSDFTAANQSTEENLRSKGLVFPEQHGYIRDVFIDWCRKKKVLE